MCDLWYITVNNCSINCSQNCFGWRLINLPVVAFVNSSCAAASRGTRSRMAFIESLCFLWMCSGSHSLCWQADCDRILPCDRVVLCSRLSDRLYSSVMQEPLISCHDSSMYASCGKRCYINEYICIAYTSRLWFVLVRESGRGAQGFVQGHLRRREGSKWWWCARSPEKGRWEALL